MPAAVTHLLLVLAAMVAYVVLTALGHDGNPIFFFVAGQVAGAGVQAKTGTPPQV